jgi:hypothetical protein
LKHYLPYALGKPLSGIGERAMAVFLDIYGNKARVMIGAFGKKELNTGTNGEK